ncbi:hypothetical protein E0493_21570 [Roseomonas sp. M0104]|uniref:Uncharacterized protein n=1 Tax=Teichococcus coralli TaxID=2545983 RepID=A0A845BIN8_9PROT|nr:transposase [Pseudoroseomonas coralli]MXP65940.1 hypothetical protein [Pseudoroseomonas coralli]
MSSTVSTEAASPDLGPAPEPERILPADAPAKLEVAARELRRANQELVALVHQIALWRALAYDRGLAERLGRSYAAQGFLTARSASLNGVVLSISRMFDGTRTALDLNATFNRILKPRNATVDRKRAAQRPGAGGRHASRSHGSGPLGHGAGGVIAPPAGGRVWLAAGPTDMRRGFDGVSRLAPPDQDDRYSAVMGRGATLT